MISDIFNVEIPLSELPNFLKTTKVDSTQKFTEFLSTMRSFQVDAFNSSKANKIGQICMPTGTGKTLVQKAIHVDDMLNKTEKGEVGIYVIASHRLGLCNQLFEQCMDLIFECGIACDMLYIGSEKYDFTQIMDKYSKKGIKIVTNSFDAKATTLSDNILMAASNARMNGHHLFIVSTYHSFGRLQTLSKLNLAHPISVCTFDEAHTTTKDLFQENINSVKNLIDRKYFFTATRRVRGEDGGQNNTEFYGQVIYEMPIRTSIETGEIVRPVIHRVVCNDDSGMSSDTNEWMMVKTITDCFNEHKKQIKACSNSPENIGAKMLITCDGLKFIREVCNNQFFIDYCRKNNINVYSFSSSDGEHMNFEKCVNRQMCICSMNNLEQCEDAILFHYDILTEGIDLPAITGVLIMRNLETIKLLQNIGRAARLLPGDRELLYKETNTDVKYIEEFIKTKLVKPYSWVIIPDYLKSLNREDARRIREMIEEIVQTYNILVEQTVVSDVALADKKTEFKKNTKDVDKTKTDKDYTLQHIIKMIEFDQISDEEKLAILEK